MVMGTQSPSIYPYKDKGADPINAEAAANFIIKKDGDNTLAIDGNTMRKVFRDTNSTKVLQYALDHYQQVAAGVGGRTNYIFLKPGRYIIDDVLSIPDANLFLRGSGSNTYASEIYLKDSTDIAAMFEYESAAGVGENTFKVFEDLKIDGNRSGGTATADAFYWHGTKPWDTWFNRVYISGMPGYGIRGITLHDMWISNCIFEYIQGPAAVSLTGNRIFINNNYLGANVEHGLYLNTVIYGFVSNNVITLCGRIPIYIMAGHYLTIIGNVTAGNHTTAAENFGDIYTYNSSLFTITGNIIYNDTEVYNHGITINGLTDSIISGNVIKGATTPISLAGTNTDTIIRDNTGYISENSGIATILNGGASIIVTHGLSSTPTVINVTGQHSEVLDLYVDTIGATYFTIHTAGGNVTANRDIYWEAKVR